MSQPLCQPARSKVLKWCFILFFVSLVVRFIFLVPVIRGNTPAIWDEYNYFYRAVGFQNILTDLLRGNPPSSADLAQAYTATWPPWQAFVLSLGLLAFGGTLAVGRSMMVVLSAAITPLVYLVTSKLSNKRAAFIAAILFAIYPSFLHYSHRLLSETTYIFIFFLMFYFALMTVEVTQPRRKVCLAAVTGSLLGFCTLTRAAGLLLSPTVALWTGWRSTGFKKRVLLPLLILISAGVTLLPWEMALFVVEDQFVVVARSSDLNLYYGNNPWLPEGYGSWLTAVSPHVHTAATEYSEKYKVSYYEAYRALALQEIKSHPVKFLKRGFYKLRAMWSADFPLFRHILMVAYPPMSNGLASLIGFIALIGFFALLALAVWGLWNPTPALRHRALIVGLVLAGTAPAFIGIGQPRFSIPLLAALLPAAGHGLAHLRLLKKEITRPWAIATLVGIAVVSVFICIGFPLEYGKIVPSSHYLNLVRQLDRWLGRETVVSDRLLFRTTGDGYPEQVIISIVGNDFEFADVEARTYNWNTSVETEVLNLVVQSQTATEPFQLRLSSESHEEAAILSLSDEAWQTWQPSNLSGVEYMWVGGSEFPVSVLGKVTANR